MCIYNVIYTCIYQTCDWEWSDIIEIREREKERGSWMKSERTNVFKALVEEALEIAYILHYIYPLKQTQENWIADSL